MREAASASQRSVSLADVHRVGGGHAEAQHRALGLQPVAAQIVHVHPALAQQHRPVLQRGDQPPLGLGITLGVGGAAHEHQALVQRQRGGFGVLRNRPQRASSARDCAWRKSERHSG